MSYTVEEVAFLAAHSDDIDEVAKELELTKKSLLADTERFRLAFGERGRAAAELAQVRRSSALTSKIPAGWLADSESLQQATPPPVALLRANRIARHIGEGSIVHDVTCSIGAEGAAITEAGLAYIGSDIDPSRVVMAAENLQDRDALVALGDALHPVSRAEVIIADPARRSGGRRITDPEQLLPPLTPLLSAYREARTAAVEMAIKCAPGIDYRDFIAAGGTVSVTSVGGAVKEACLYTPGLSGAQHREAIVVGATGSPTDYLDDLMDDGAGRDLSGPSGTWIIDPDGAIVRAGLVRHYAVREGLWMLDERIAYLTGERLPEGRSGFPFIEEVPIKALRAKLKEHDAASVEILVRGVDIDPDDLRRKLKLKGSRPMAVIITRIGRAGVALICGARSTG